MDVQEEQGYILGVECREPAPEFSIQCSLSVHRDVLTCVCSSPVILFISEERSLFALCVSRAVVTIMVLNMLQCTTCAWHLCMCCCWLPDPPSSLLTRWQPVTQKSWLTSLVPCKTCWGDSLPEWIVMLEWYGSIQCSGWPWCIALISDGVPSVL